MTDDQSPPAADDTASRLGPPPEPTTQSPQLRPGGADAIDDPKYGDTPGPPTIPDADPEENPAVEDALPDEIAAPDDKQQEPDDDARPLDGESSGDGAPEPPA